MAPVRERPAAAGSGEHPVQLVTARPVLPLQVVAGGPQPGGPNQALDRYVLAFEEGKLDMDRFGARVDQLAQTSRKLQQQKDSLLAALQQTDTRAPAEELLATIRATIREAVEIDEFRPKRALVSTLVQHIEVRSRKEIYPTFRVPTATELDNAKVRMPVGLVGATGIEPVTSAV